VHGAGVDYIVTPCGRRRRGALEENLGASDEAFPAFGGAKMILLAGILGMMRRREWIHRHPADRIDGAATGIGTVSLVVTTMSMSGMSTMVRVGFTLIVLIMAVTAVLRFHLAPSESHMMPFR
jgi:hypothetical protein